MWAALLRLDIHHPDIKVEVSIEPALTDILTAQQLVAQGLGVALLPTLLAGSRRDLRALTEPLDETTHDPWLLTHRDSRHLRRISTVFRYLARELSLE